MVNLIPIGLFFVCYSLAAFFIKFFFIPPEDITRKEQKDYLGQHLSILHAYAATIGSCILYVLEGGIDYNAPTNEWHEIVISVKIMQNSIGYFIFDTVYAEVYKLHDNLMRFHHVFGLICLFTMLYSPIGGSASMLGILIAEISNPCILKRHLLRAKRLENSFSYTFYENSFVFLFISARIIWGFWYLLRVWDSKINWVYACMASSIYTLSWFWVFIIIAKAMKSFSGTDNKVLQKFNSAIRFLKGQKGLLLLIFLAIGYGIPLLLTQALNLHFVQVEVDGFQII